MEKLLFIQLIKQMLYSFGKRGPKYSELGTINFLWKVTFKLCLKEWYSFTMHREGKNISGRREHEQRNQSSEPCVQAWSPALRVALCGKVYVERQIKECEKVDLNQITEKK